MTLPPTRLRIAILLAALAAGSIPAAPSAGAGDMLDNVKDGLGCMTKAVFGPLRGFARAFEAFGTDDESVKEGLRDADGSVKEALKECGEALENIYARGFGVEKIVGKARDTAALAKSAVDRVAKWSGKGAAPDDPRMALAVDKEERRFYEKETGVLDRKPLPAPDDNSTRSSDEMQPRGADSVSAWDGEAARDPWSGDEGGEGSGGRNDARRPAARDQADPWGETETEVAAQTPPTPVADEYAEADYEDSTYSVALSEVLGDTTQQETTEDGYVGALAALERREAEARRAAEVERQRAEEREAEQARQEAEREAARLRAEREAEQAWQQAEREAARLRAEREAEQAWQQAEREAAHARQRAEREAEQARAARRAEREAWAKDLATTISQGLAAIAAAKRGHIGSSGIPPVPSSSGQATVPDSRSGSQGVLERWCRSGRSVSCGIK